MLNLPIKFVSNFNLDCIAIARRPATDSLQPAAKVFLRLSQLFQCHYRFIFHRVRTYDGSIVISTIVMLAW